MANTMYRTDNTTRPPGIGSLPLKVVLGCALMFGAGTGSASESWLDGWELSHGIVGAFSNLDDLTTQASVGTGELIESGFLAGRRDGFLQKTQIDDLTAGLSIAVLRPLAGFRAGAQYQYRYRTDLDSAAVTNSIQRPTSFNNNIGTHTLAANVVRDLGQWRSWRLHAGASVGVARHRNEGRLTVRAGNGFAQEQQFHDTVDYDLTWQLEVGMYRKLQADARGGLEVLLMYTDLGEVQTGPFSTGARLRADLTSIDLVLRYRWGG